MITKRKLRAELVDTRAAWHKAVTQRDTLLYHCLERGDDLPPGVWGPMYKGVTVPRESGDMYLAVGDTLEIR